MSCSPALVGATVFVGSLAPAAAAADAVTPEPGLEVRYTFESIDDGSVLDVSGHNRHGRIVGSAEHVVLGQSMALVFDGATRVECGPILPAALKSAASGMGVPHCTSTYWKASSSVAPVQGVATVITL